MRSCENCKNSREQEHQESVKEYKVTTGCIFKGTVIKMQANTCGYYERKNNE